MSDSKTLLYNQALAQAGITRRIALPEEASNEAEICELYYDLLRTNVLSAAHWPCASKAFRLNQLGAKDETTSWTQGDPLPGWLYAYALPSDYVRAQYINNMDFFRLARHTDAGGTDRAGIVTNCPNVVMTYSFDQTNIDAWEEPLRMAMMFALAGMISYGISRKFNRTLQLIQQANDQIKTARDETFNSEEYQQDRLAPWIGARGSVYNVTHEQNYIYPYGPLLRFEGLITNTTSSS